MKLLITRPMSAAREMKSALETMGHDVILSPLLEISFRNTEPLDIEKVQALIVTSANGVKGLVRATENRSIPVYAVGDKSAAVAKQSGFEKIFSANGDVDDLARLIKERLPEDGGTLVHAGGARLAGDLGGDLQKAGYSYRREILYDAHDAEGLTPVALSELKAGKLDGVLVFSPHTAKVLKQIIDADKLYDHISKLSIWCLSQNVANALSDLQAGQIFVAEHPTEKDLLALIEKADPKDKNSAQTEGGKVREHKVAVPPSGKDTAKGNAKPDAKEASKQADAKSAPPKTPTGKVDAKSSGPTTAAASSKTETTAAKPAAKKGSNTKWVLAGVGGAFILGLVAWPLILPKVAPVLPEGTQAMLKGYWPENPAIKTLEERLAALESSKTTAPVQNVDLGAVNAQIAALQKSLDEKVSLNRADLETLSGRLGEIETAKAELEASISKLQNAAPIAVTPTGDEASATEALQAALNTRLQDLGDSLSKAQAEIARLSEQQVTTKSGLDDQQTEISALSAAVKAAAETKQVADANGNESLILLALGQIHRESRADQPFTGALQQAIAVAPEGLQADFAKLSDVSKSGAPTIRQLVDEFEAEASNITQAARLPDSETWYGKTLHNLASLVKFRRVGDTEGDDVDAIVARAEKALLGADLTGAIAALSSLEGASREAASGWIANAQKRALLDQTLDELIKKVSANAALDSQASN
ncbi:hypothetical protein GUA87_05290 [Sneathiella sp. P13V-1]|uniref:uroporphyrinogen-III synthase n=1 Tax=Sneathiella sp. P13V-1 TaxID=2697366 RepID=UPI00187BB917|nr:uroporphyrinogen-III synthase [Sneathiella sp. P13V-1]MBE7636248.1 hypothetical protein [Sneathiella sp. P13V-1]